MNFDLAHTLLQWLRLLALAGPIIAMAAASDVEKEEEDRFSYAVPRDLGTAPFDPSEFGE